MWELIYSVGWDIDRYIDDKIDIYDDCGVGSGVDVEFEIYVNEFDFSRSWVWSWSLSWDL